MPDYPSSAADRLFTIGLDYGSLSCRGILTDVRSGAILAEETFVYPHGVMDASLPDGTPLLPGWHLQHPSDYLDALQAVIPALVKKSGVSPGQIVGIGTDATASTVIPVDENMQPLCLNPDFAPHPHAWPKMWKHHAACSQAEKLTAISREQRRPYLDRYGGAVSSECLISKVIETFECDRTVYDAAYAFMELADWIPSQLAGAPIFSTALASAKAFYDIKSGYPDGDFFAAVHPDLEHLPEDKLIGRFPHHVLTHPCNHAGGLSRHMAEALGLCAGTVVTPGHMDAYTPMAALGIDKPGVMMMIMGTSTGIMLLGDEGRPVSGVTASLPDTFFPGLWGYASGQASVGDGLQWFADHCVPGKYERAAESEGLTVQQYLTKLAQRLSPGETGLICLDWINGNKSCLGNPRLSGMFLGLNLQTTPEQIYRAMVEGTAFGARMIAEAYRAAGVAVNEIRACGGIAGKNPLMMQIYADVMGMPISVSRCTQVPALGAAIYAAAAAGEKTGYPSIFAAMEAMAEREFTVYMPDERRHAAYETLYREYRTLHDYFGCGENRVMERLYAQRTQGGILNHQKY
ncbi:MAG: ribulokinase [Clostridia bacterium]|nr:ribulokinase [Clostridia bacterium]